jgi:hypothetical protein
MNLRKPNREVLARLAQNEEDNFVSAGRHRLGKLTGVRAIVISSEQKLLVNRVRKNKIPVKTLHAKKVVGGRNAKIAFRQSPIQNTFADSQ